MALELRSIVTVMAETDDHNKNVIKDLQDKNTDLEKQIKKLTNSTNKQRTWQLKTTNQVRRNKTLIKNMNKTIERLETDNTELKTENDELKTENDELQTQNIELEMDTEQNTIDFSTITKRLADHSCPYCGTPAPRTDSIGTQTQVTFNKHFTG